MNIFEQIGSYLQYDFVRYALIVGTLISLCCAILGVTLVLKRYAMIGDGLSHVAFGAMTIAMVLTIADMYLMLPITILVAILLISLTNKGKVKNDSAIAMLSVGALSFGYLIVSLFSTSANGTKVSVYNSIMAIITGVIIVLAMKLVGSLLISALIVFPALSAIRLFKSYKMVIIFSSIISVLSSVFGILVSMLWGTPVGATIVVINIFTYFVCWLLEIIIKNSKGTKRV
mgnify:CR=1 FL=1